MMKESFLKTKKGRARTVTKRIDLSTERTILCQILNAGRSRSGSAPGRVRSPGAKVFWGLHRTGISADRGEGRALTACTAEQ
jgi:hypothetical protein